MNINNNVPFLIVTYIPSKYETNIDKMLMGAYIDWMSVAQHFPFCFGMKNILNNKIKYFTDKT